MNSKKITNMALTAIILMSSPFAYTQTLEEVIVTAQIREQSLQDVPI